ncbi:GAF domain-containing sensor histidine kinase [Christiangramia aquimixticola]|uniref:GAF domain-containing sensor histidine kinase n=1 Tax=Christiangramia aquimixticola TaxID=1697558 RepID=UPI003AA97429
MLNLDVNSRINEYRRIKKLSEFDLDYAELQQEFKSLVELTALISGTDAALINLIDNYFQWTVTSHIGQLMQIPREESLCNKTIQSNDILEIPELDKDDYYKEKVSSKGDSGFNYYMGIPLQLNSGENIGALCIVNKTSKPQSSENKQLLKLIAVEVVSKLENNRKLNDNIHYLNKMIKVKNQLAHDVRGPLNGITNLAELVEDDDPDREEMKQYFKLIKESGRSLLELTDDILSEVSTNFTNKEASFNLKDLKAKLLKLYRLLAKSKGIELNILLKEDKIRYSFPKRRLLSIFGNLISNAIKFTPSGGEIQVNLDIVNSSRGRCLNFIIEDSGIGISEADLQELQKINHNSSQGTKGEKGFGLGLELVHEMVQELKGDMDITSVIKEGTKIDIKLPIK